MKLTWSIKAIKLELNYTWKISRNSSEYKINYIIACSDGTHTAFGEVAPNIRYHETPEVIEQEFTTFLQSAAEQVTSIHDLTALLNGLPLKNALRFGIESAYIHLLCKQQRISLSAYLQLPQQPFVHTCYTIPILSPDETIAFYEQHQLHRFSLLKLKINKETGLDVLHQLQKVSNSPLLVDPNESFSHADELINFMHAAKSFNIQLIEQPLPADKTEDYAAAKKTGLFPLIADESVCDDADFEQLTLQFDCVNMKLMKAGGYLNGIRILQEAKKHQLQTMVGCMVETSLGIYGAASIATSTQYADLDGFMIVKDEPYKMVREENGFVFFNENKF